MWLKTEDKQYVNPDNGSVLYVRSYHEAMVGGVHNVLRWHIRVEGARFNSKVLRGGYETEDEAYAALDEFMATQEFVEIQPPVSDEEKADSEEGK